MLGAVQVFPQFFRPSQEGRVKGRSVYPYVYMYIKRDHAAFIWMYSVPALNKSDFRYSHIITQLDLPGGWQELDQGDNGDEVLLSWETWRFMQ